MDKTGGIGNQPTLLARVQACPLRAGIGLVGIGLGGFALSKAFTHPLLRGSAVALNTAGFGYWLHTSYALTPTKPKERPSEQKSYASTPTKPKEGLSEQKPTPHQELPRFREWFDVTPCAVDHAAEFSLPRVQVRPGLPLPVPQEQATAWRACWRTSRGNEIEEDAKMQWVHLALPDCVNIPNWFADASLPASLMPSDRQTKTAWMIWEGQDKQLIGCQVVLEKAPVNKRV